MRKHRLLFITFLLLCALILGGVVALANQEGKQHSSVNGSSSTVSEPTKKQDQTQEQDCKRDRINQNEDAPCFTAEDGSTYRWQHRFNRKLHKFEERGDEEAMNKYLQKIASRYTFENNSCADDFVHWAIQNRPWDTE